MDLFVDAIPFAVAVALAMVIVQTLDAGVGIAIRDRLKTIGPAVTALLGLVTLVWLLFA